MTLQTSFPLSISQINQEFGVAQNAAFDMSSTKARWLAEDADGDISLSSFLGKRSVKLVQITGRSEFGTQHDFSVDLGLDFPGRVIIVGFCLCNKGTSELVPFTIADANVNGANITTDVYLSHNTISYQESNSPSLMVAAGIGACTPAGTSGTLTFTTSLPCHAKAFILSASHLGIEASAVTGQSRTGAPATTMSDNLTTVPNGVLISIAAASASLNDLSLHGVDTQWRTFESNIDGNDYTWVMGVRNRMSAGSVTVGATSSKQRPGAYMSSMRSQSG
mgnify:FL=1